MRRVVLTLFIIIASLCSASASSLLDTIERTLADMGAYSVKFTIGVDNRLLNYYYIIDGENSYLQSEGFELFIADGQAYEVNNDKREIVQDSATNYSKDDVFINPTRLCAYLKQNYTATACDKGLKLTPAQGGYSILLESDSSGKLPYKIIYSEGDASITVLFTSIQPYSEPLPRFSREKYAEYELVDMR